ncbi:DUF4179 domain-containing protein [Bacillus cereus group sp. BfR-BA-01380]|uniref:DUF4179 domain-containing protein n=1 Tax=Bacillus cereus group sp. BfR-BA-01380 TaxID=2920324 RepID=UPI001F569865|nr:DUF4179 domain-containing protein [Bacillus cereus group sp. BfR-BA-01380]
MKNIYELLNDVDIDETEFKEMEVSELEKEKVKRALKQSIHNKKKAKSWKMKIVAATVIVGLLATTFGLAFPTYAGSLPIMGDIFRFLDNGRTGLYDRYKEFSTEMNMTKESNGIKVTINDAIFDGKTTTLTYSIESEQDLGDKPDVFDNLDLMDANGMTGSSQISKVAEKKYVGLVTATHQDPKKKDSIKVSWNVEGIKIPNQKKEITGDWNFAFTLKAIDNNEKSISGSTEKDGVKVNMEKLTITPMSFIVYYNQEVSKEVRKTWDDVDVELEVKDDLGNQYSGKGNGGRGKDLYNISWSKTFQKLDKNATKLIITPHVNSRIHTPNNHGGVEMTGGKEKKISVPEKAGGEKKFVLEDIVIYLKK